MEPPSPRSTSKAVAGGYSSIVGVKSPRIRPPPALIGLPTPPQSPLEDNRLPCPSTTATALPPLVQSGESSQPSPRYAQQSGFTLRPVPFPLQLDRDYPVAHVDNWPLTSSSSPRFGSPVRSPRSEISPASPLSPRVRKNRARHQLFDDSKSKPLLLQELDAFIKSELQAIGQSDSDRQEFDDVGASQSETIRRPPNLVRLNVFREVFCRVIDSFSVYAPLLARVKAEYERTIDHLLAKCQLLPQLHSELQSLETQCLRELSKHQLETKMFHKELRQQLKDTQGQLTACAAQRAHLLDDNKSLRDQIQRLEQRNQEMHLSNNTLVSGIKRHDDTLRHIHERSREEGMALQQMTLKYHRACDEIAELKKTVATLEEKVGGVHVAADKATIALLTKDLQEIHSKWMAATAAPPNRQDEETVTMPQEIHRLLFKVLETNGAPCTMQELIEQVAALSVGANPSLPTAHKPTLTRLGSVLPFSSVASSSSLVGSPSRLGLPSPTKTRPAPNPLVGIAPADLAFGVDRVAAQMTEKIASFHRQKLQLLHRFSAQEQSTDSTFLTEPDDVLSLANANEQILAPLLSTIDYIQTKGLGYDVPGYLRYEGVVRNLYFDRKRVELLISKIWSHKDDLDAKAKRQSPSAPSVPLAEAFSLYLQRCFPTSRHDQVECAYNVVASLGRFASASSDCRLFSLVLDGEIPSEARADQAKELIALHDALFAIHRERKAEHSRAGAGSGLPLACVIQALRRHYPWKSDAQLGRLHQALLLDLRGHSQVDYATLLTFHDDHQSHPRTRMNDKPRPKSQFVECLRSQHLDDLLGFRKHLQRRIQDECITATGSADHATTALDGGEGTMVAVGVLRDCLQRCDVAKPVQEINKLLLSATELTMDQILTHDALMVSATEFVAKLPTLLVKPMGKFDEGPIVSAFGSTPLVSRLHNVI